MLKNFTMNKDELLKKMEAKKKEMEYLRRPEESTRVYVTDKEVIVGSHSFRMGNPDVSDDTLPYISVKKLDRIVKEDILKLYSEVERLAKARNLQITYNMQYKRLIEENWDRYREEFKYFNELFDKERELGLQMKRRGLHRGFFSDDKVFREALGLSREYEKHYNPKLSAVGLIQDIYSSLKLYEREMSRSLTYESNYIYGHCRGIIEL